MGSLMRGDLLGVREAVLEVLDGADAAAARRGGGDDGRDADAVVGRARHLDAGQARDVGADGGDRVDVADGVLRQARRPSAARARRRRGAGGGRAASPTSATATRRRGRRRRAGGRPPRGRGRRRPAGGRRSSDSSPVQAHLRKLNVLALIVRPSTGGTRKPDPGRSPSPARSTASVTTAVEAVSTSAERGGRRGRMAARAGARPGPGGRRRGRRRRRPPRGSAAEPTTSRQPVARALQAAHDGAGAQRRPARRQLVGEQAGQPADPATQAGEGRTRAAARSDADRLSDAGPRMPCPRLARRQQALAAGRPLPQHRHRRPQRQP